MSRAFSKLYGFPGLPRVIHPPIYAIFAKFKGIFASHALYVTAYAYVTQASKSVNVRRGLSHKTEREGGRERETENSLVRVSKAQSES